MDFQSLNRGNRVYYVVGLARSGLALISALTAHNIPVIAYDDNANRRAECQKEFPELAIVSPSKVDWGQISALVLSPGIPHYSTPHVQAHEAAVLAENHGVEIICDIELFSRCVNRNQIIAVTGTNGKSTTSAMIAHFLKEAGCEVRLGGNIGKSVFDLSPLENDNGYYVIECSSYQLERSPTFSPGIAVWTNIAPSHLDRHGKIETYVHAKSRIFARNGEPQRVVMGITDSFSQALYEDIKCRKNIQVTPISVQGMDEGFKTNEQGVRALDSQKFYPLSDYTTHKGRVYSQNLAAAFGVLKYLELLDHVKTDHAYQALPHRQQSLGHINNIEVINDSKATNVPSCLAALDCYRNVYLLLGGVPKGDSRAPCGLF